MRAKGFHHISYERHTSSFADYASGERLESRAKTWLEKDTLDAFRHQRMYEMLDPLLEAEPGAKWLTVGDGRYGRDAKYILDKGCEALATDISNTLLKEAKASGYIADYQKENAESLTFVDNEFDYVFCKESYHHFPRPTLALYEMLRVASKGVVLIEPNDVVITDRFTEILYSMVTRIIKGLLFRRKGSCYDFEEAGNFIYTLSRREIEKAALGLNLNTVAFNGINDYYENGFECVKISSKCASCKKFRRKILISNIRTRLGLVGHHMLVAVIFKAQPSEDIIRSLGGNGYTIVNLPKNPFI